MKRIALSTALAALIVAGSAQAQGGPPRQNRPGLEQQLRQRVAEITRKRLQLDDTQMSKLQAVNARFAPQLAALVTQERQSRQQLRSQMTAPAPDQGQVASLLDNLLRIQKQRIELMESEQKELSAFLTPVQRAKYLALQNEIRRRAEQLRSGAAGGARRRAQMEPPR